MRVRPLILDSLKGTVQGGETLLNANLPTNTAERLDDTEETVEADDSQLHSAAEQCCPPKLAARAFLQLNLTSNRGFMY